MAAASAARHGPARVPAACMTVRSTAASPSGQESGGVPRAAVSAAPTRQEQVHEGEPAAGAYHHVGSQHHVGPQHNVGPSAGHHVGPVGATRRGDVRVSRNTRTLPAPRRGRRRGRTRSGSASVGTTALSRTRQVIPAARDGVAGRKRDTIPAPPGARPPQPGVRGSRPRPGRHEHLSPDARRRIPVCGPGLRVFDGAWRPAQGKRTRQPDLGRTLAGPADGPSPARPAPLAE
jgi:hypothetical protein